MKMSDKPHDLRATGSRPRQTQGQLRRLGAGIGEPHPLCTGHQALDPLRPLQLELGTRPVVEALHELVLYGLQDVRMVVAEQEPTVPACVVDVLVAIHVPLAGTGCARDVDPVGLDVAGVVGDATGKQAAGAFGESGRACGPAQVGLDQC